MYHGLGLLSVMLCGPLLVVRGLSFELTAAEFRQWLRASMPVERGPHLAIGGHGRIFPKEHAKDFGVRPRVL
jgi:hypothetical protein